MEASELDDFTTYDGNVMTATPEGYYVIQKDFLYYISPDFQSSTIVCSKPDCIHNEQDLGRTEQFYETSNCRLEWDDYGILTEVQEYISYNPMQWTSKYFHVLPDSGEKVQLTEEDFQSIGTNDMLYNMDDKYIYFGTINIGVDALPEEEQVLTVYDYEGNIKAKIPAGDFGNYYFVLPGTDEHLFITKMNTDGSDAYFYADKSEFDGGIVEAHEINFAGIR